MRVELGNRSLLRGSIESFVAIIIFLRDQGTPDEEPRRKARELQHPFASITWGRFNGSATLPRGTLSLCPHRDRYGSPSIQVHYVRTHTDRRQVRCSLAQILC